MLQVSGCHSQFVIIEISIYTCNYSLDILIQFNVSIPVDVGFSRIGFVLYVLGSFRFNTYLRQFMLDGIMPNYSHFFDFRVLFL